MGFGTSCVQAPRGAVSRGAASWPVCMGVLSASFVLGFTMLASGVNNGARLLTWIGVHTLMPQKGVNEGGCDLASVLGYVAGGVLMPIPVRGADFGCLSFQPHSRKQVWGGGGETAHCQALLVTKKASQS